MTTIHTDAQLIARALDWLAAGLLASALPGRLMADYGISRERAARLAGEALRRWRAGSAAGEGEN